MDADREALLPHVLAYQGGMPSKIATIDLHYVHQVLRYACILHWHRLCSANLSLGRCLLADTAPEILQAASRAMRHCLETQGAFMSQLLVSDAPWLTTHLHFTQEATFMTNLYMIG